jgi:hypothetical protein
MVEIVKVPAFVLVVLVGFDASPGESPVDLEPVLGGIRER